MALIAPSPTSASPSSPLSSLSSSLSEHRLGAASLFDMSLKKTADSSDAAVISRLPSHILARLVQYQQQTIQDLRTVVQQREVHDRVMTDLAPVQYRLMATPLDRRLVDGETSTRYGAEAASIRACWTVSSTPGAYIDDDDDDETNMTSAWIRTTCRDGEISTTLATNRLSHLVQSPFENFLSFSQVQARLFAVMRRPVILGGGVGALVHRTGGMRLVFINDGGRPEQWLLRVAYHHDDSFDEAEEDALELCDFLLSEKVMIGRSASNFGMDIESGTPAAVTSCAVGRWLSRQLGGRL